MLTNEEILSNVAAGNFLNGTCLARHREHIQSKLFFVGHFKKNELFTTRNLYILQNAFLQKNCRNICR